MASTPPLPPASAGPATPPLAGPSRPPSRAESKPGSRPASPPSVDAAAVLARANPGAGQRVLVALCFPLLFLLAVPFWYATTSIERLPLPSDRIAALASAPYPLITSHILFTAEDDVFPVPPPGKAVFSTRVKLDALAAEVVKGIDSVELRKRPADRGRRTWEFVYDDEARRPAPLRLHMQVEESTTTAFPLEPYVLPPSSAAAVPAGTLVIPVHPSLISDRNLKQHYKIAISKALLELSPHYDHNVPLRALAYAPNVTLSFVLLNEDASGGGYVRTWDIERAIEDHIMPHLGPLAPVFNFSIESQVLFHAPLSFEPAQTTLPDRTQAVLEAAATDDAVEAAAPAAVDAASQASWVISEEEAKVFVNSERWSLDSGSTNNPVLRFLLFVPSPAHRPMHLALTPDASPSDAFLLPQYGGVVIVNPPADATTGADAVFHLGAPALDAPFALFTRHLYELLDLPLLPGWMRAPEPAPVAGRTSAHRAAARLTQPISPWQVETVLRTRLRENAGEAAKTLAGIVRLVDKIKEMQVGAGVQALVEGAVRRLEGLPVAARANSPLPAFLLARDATVLASRAFFDPSMMGQLYFHKFAVYTPLFAPVGVAMAVALLRELAALIKRRRAARAARAHEAGSARARAASAVADEWAALEAAATPRKRARLAGGGAPGPVDDSEGERGEGGGPAASGAVAAAEAGPEAPLGVAGDEEHVGLAGSGRGGLRARGPRAGTEPVESDGSVAGDDAAVRRRSQRRRPAD